MPKAKVEIVELHPKDAYALSCNELIKAGAQVFIDKEYIKPSFEGGEFIKGPFHYYRGTNKRTGYFYAAKIKFL